MGIFEIVLIIFCSLLVLSVAIKYIIDRKHGKCNCDLCDGNCSCCKKYKKEVKS